MVKWKGRKKSKNVEDRRGKPDTALNTVTYKARNRIKGTPANEWFGDEELVKPPMKEAGLRRLKKAPIPLKAAGENLKVTKKEAKYYEQAKKKKKK